MTPDEDYAADLNFSQIHTVIDHINMKLMSIWVHVRYMKKETLSGIQDEYLDRILDAEYQAYWMLRDLPTLLPRVYRPVTPNPFLTKLADVEKEFIGSYRHRDVGTRLLQDAPDFLNLTLGYRDLVHVVTISHRLLFILEKLQDQGAEVCFQSTTKLSHQNQTIHIQVDCYNEELLILDEDLFFQIPLPYQEVDRGPHSISGLEFMIAKQCLLGMGGDFIAEKEGDHVRFVLILPTIPMDYESSQDLN
jgi:hypothetical protein